MPALDESDLGANKPDRPHPLNPRILDSNGIPGKASDASSPESDDVDDNSSQCSTDSEKCDTIDANSFAWALISSKLQDFRKSVQHNIIVKIRMLI